MRLGDDQVHRARPAARDDRARGPECAPGSIGATRHATECNHTATHLLHAALRRRLGTHVHQAGSYVGPDKLRFDFTHGSGLAAEELADVENEVNAWILASHPVRALTTTLDEARRLGAMALFGEKYGDIVRMVEVGDGSFSRELCGGTHVRSTAEIGLFKMLSESSSAANVRRIEAVTGPAAVELVRAHDRALSRGRRDAARSAGAGARRWLRRSCAADPRTGASGSPRVRPATARSTSSSCLPRAAEIGGAHVLVSGVPSTRRQGAAGRR